MTAISAAHSERTAWLDASSSPARPGVYERRAPAGPYACWDGECWRHDAPDVASAAQALSASPRQRAPWRGLVEAADAPCATCRGHTVLDRGIDLDSGADRIEECPDC